MGPKANVKTFLNAHNQFTNNVFQYSIRSALKINQGLLVQLILQFNFLIALDTCNSLYLYVMSANRQAT
jgi:hypothetical protein